MKISKRTRTNFFTYAGVIVAYIIIQILLSGGNISSSLSGQLVPICAYVIMALSLNLTVGVLGELSLGHAGFMSIGAFMGTIMAVSLETSVASPWLRLVLGIVFGAVCAGIFGIIIGIPVLRLKGDYLAIVTLAFGEIIKNLINCLYVGVDEAGLHVSFLTNSNALGLSDSGKVILDGPTGLSGITKLSTFTAGIILIIISLIIILNLVNSRSGRAIMALRDNRIAAESIGISVTKYKLMAFTISAAIAGAAGALYAMNYSTLVASKFNFNQSILILVFVVLGGLGNMWGSIIAATVLTLLPELLRGFESYRMLIYAIVLILVMIATNNSQVKGLFMRIFSSFRKKNAEEDGGGGKQNVS